MSQSGVISVQHCVLATVARKHGNRPVFDLLEVQYEHAVAPDTEFPKFIAKFDLFVRLIARSAGPTRLRIRVRRQVRPGEWELVNDFYDPINTLAFPSDRNVVLSDSFRLSNVKLTGTGLHTIKVYFRPLGRPWELGATEFFYVVR